MAPKFVRRASGPALTILGILLAEIARDIPLAAPVPVVVLLTVLVAVAYAGLAGGFLQGILGSFILGVYSLHFLSPAGTLVDPTFTVIQGASIMTGLGLAMSMPMALVKRREDRLRRELEARAATVEARNLELTDANLALEAFGYVVSHDLKEPVRAIKAYLENAREERDPAESRRDIEKAYEANERLGRLLQGLLDYSRASSLATTVRQQDLGLIIGHDTCRAQFDRVLQEKKASLEVASDLPPILGDEVILCQLFGNLVLNALRHGGPSPRVRIRAAPPTGPGLAHVVVEDDGPGFPPDVVKRFVKIRSNRPSTVKNGFGLIIAHRATQRMGGRLWLENPAEGGARVHVELASP